MVGKLLEVSILTSLNGYLKAFLSQSFTTLLQLAETTGTPAINCPMIEYQLIKNIQNNNLVKAD